MLRNPILLPIALMLFLALLTFWINQTVQEQTRRLNGMQRHDPDYNMYDFVSSRTDANGHTRYALAASALHHFPDNDTTELQRPRFTQFGQVSTNGKNTPYTQIQGQRGFVSGKGDQVEFVENVRVVRGATEKKGEMELRTERLTIEPDAEVARTDLPVIIRQQPATVITATGMHFDKKSETIQLFNRVHVHYERATTGATPKQKTVPMRTTAKAVQ